MSFKKIIRDPVNQLLVLGVAFILFDLSYYFMNRLPGHDGLTCTDGGNLTPLNIGFSALMSVLIALMIVMMREVFKARKARLMSKGAVLSGAGFFVGFFTVFCTVCSLPVISLFGFGTVLWWFVNYNIWFKILSLILIVFGLKMLNNQLKNECNICR